MDLSELLQWLANGTKTGILTLERDRLTKKIGFRDGRIVSVESNDPSEHLGQFLLAYGKLDTDTLKRAFATQEKVGLRLGEILVQVNLLRKEDLADMLRIQAVEIIYSLFLSEDGSFRFDDLNAPASFGDLALDPSGLIMEGVYRFDEWKRYREVFPTEDMTVQAMPGWEPASDEEKLLAQLIAQGKTLGEICYEFRTSKFHTYGQLHELYMRKSIAIDRIGELPKVEKARDTKLVDLFDSAGTAVRERRFDEALSYLEAVLRHRPNDPGDEDVISKADKMYSDLLITRFIDPRKIPRVNLPPELLTEKKFNPAEGYLISRVDGSWDVASIIRISPLPESEALGIFKRFIDENIVVLT